MSRRHDIDARALTASLLQAVKEARAAQTALEEAAKEKNRGQTITSIEAIRERLALLAELRDMGMEVVRVLDRQLNAAREADGSEVALELFIEAANAFAKLSRAIRLVIMLETRAEDALRAALELPPAAAADRPVPQAAPKPAAPEPVAAPAPEASPKVATAEGRETLSDSEHLSDREPAEKAADPDKAAADLRAPPASAVGLQPRPRAMAAALSGASPLAFIGAAPLRPPDARSRRK